MKAITVALLGLLFCVPASGHLIVGIEGINYKPSHEIEVLFPIEAGNVKVLKGIGVELGRKSKFYEMGVDVNFVKATASETNPSITGEMDIYQFTPRAAFIPPLKGSPIYPYFGLGFPYHMVIEKIRGPSESWSETNNPGFGIEPFIGINYSPIKQLGFRVEGRDQFAKPSDDPEIQGLRLTAGIVFQY